MGCRIFDCLTCVAVFVFERVREAMERVRALTAVVGAVGMAQATLTVPKELRDLITLGRVAAFRRAAWETYRAVVLEILASQLRPGDLLFLRVQLHPAGDREPGVWKPHMHVQSFAAGYNRRDGTVRPLDLSPLRSPAARKLLRTRWRARLRKLTGKPCRLPWATITVHGPDAVRFVLEREARSFPGWGEAGRSDDEAKLYRAISRTDWAGAFASNVWGKGKITGVEPATSRSLVTTLALTPSERKAVAKANPMHAVATVIAHNRRAELYRPGGEVGPISALAEARPAPPPPPPPGDVADFVISVPMWRVTRTHCLCDVCRPSVERLHEADRGAKLSTRALALAFRRARGRRADVTAQRATAEEIAATIRRDAARLGGEPVSVQWAIDAIEAAVSGDLAFFAEEAWWPTGVSRWLLPSELRRVREALPASPRRSKTGTRTNPPGPVTGDDIFT